MLLQILSDFQVALQTPYILIKCPGARVGDPADGMRIVVLKILIHFDISRFTEFIDLNTEITRTVAFAKSTA